MNQAVVCDVCGKRGARYRRITRTYGRGANLLVIENIPVTDCPSCGEVYFEANTLRAIEKIKRQRKRLAKARPVAVASL